MRVSKKWWLILLVLPFLYLLMIGGFYLFQDRIIFQSSKLQPDFAFEFEQPFKEYMLTTNEEVKINALLFEAENKSRGIVLYFHGNADNLKRWGQYTTDFTSRGYDVLAIDYRGYGKSKGQPSEKALYQDAENIYHWISKKYLPDEVVIYGRSLGSSVATYLAGKSEARMLILETPFNNIKNVIQKNATFLWLPFELNYSFSVDKTIEQVQMPIHIIHGTDDEIVPYELGEKLKEKLKPGDNFFAIQNGKHKNLSTFEAYHSILDRILGIDEFAGE